MAEERIDIEVNDKVDASVASKFEVIADAAEKAEDYVGKLQRALAAVNSSSVDKLASALARTETSSAKLMNAQARLATANSASEINAAKAGLAQQKLATETERTNAAQARAATASNNAAAAAARLAAAESQAALSALRLEQAQKRVTTANNGTADSLGRVRSHNANIMAQLQDIGVSLAGGQNPFLVMIQQGSQLSYVAGQMDGGFKALTLTILRMLAPFAAVAAVLGVLFVNFKLFQNEINTEHKKELEDYANSLGLTDKEMRKLSNSSVGAGGKLKEFNNITVTSGDMWNGFVATVKQGIDQIGFNFDSAGSTMRAIWDTTTSYLNYAFKLFYAFIVSTVRTLTIVFSNFGTVVKDTLAAAANAGIASIEWMVNKAIDGLNWMIQKANPILDKVGLGMEEMGHTALGRIKSSGMDIISLLDGEMRMAGEEYDATLKGFRTLWEKNSVEASKARLRTLRDAIVANRNPAKAKTDHTAENRAKALMQVNLALDNELSRMKMLKDARAEQQKFDQIEQQLAGKKIKLNAEEEASIKAKIHAIQEYARVQSESDRIEQEINGPLLNYNATLAASDHLLKQGVLTQQQYNEQLAKAQYIYDRTQDPLLDYNKAITDAATLTGKYGDALEDAVYLQQIQQTLEAQGKTLYDASTGALTTEAAALLKRNQELRNYQFIQSQLSSVLDPILQGNKEIQAKEAVYAELNRLREQDKIDEDSYQRAIAALAVKYQEQRLTAASGFFGALADVTKNGNGAIGAINKAAAVAQATIDGYLAVQKALASAPPPWNYVAAAAVGLKTGAQVAGIMSTNAGSYATGGQFTVGGRSGIDSNNINMNVTRGERVTIETRKQAAQNDNNAAGGTPVVMSNTKVANYFDEKSFLAAIDTEDGEEVIMNVISRRKNDVGNIVRGSGS